MNYKLFLLVFFGLAGFVLAVNDTNSVLSCNDTGLGSGYVMAGGSVYIPPWTMVGLVKFCGYYGGTSNNDVGFIRSRTVIVNNSNVTEAACCIRVTKMVCPAGFVQTKKSYGGSNSQVSSLSCSLSDKKVVGFDGLNNFAICCGIPPASNVTCPSGYIETKRYYPTLLKGAYDDFGHWGVTDQNFTCNSSDKKLFNLDENSRNVNLCCKKKIIILTPLKRYLSKGSSCDYRNAASCVNNNCNWYGGKSGKCTSGLLTCTASGAVTAGKTRCVGLNSGTCQDRYPFCMWTLSGCKDGWANSG